MAAKRRQKPPPRRPSVSTGSGDQEKEKGRYLLRRRPSRNNDDEEEQEESEEVVEDMVLQEQSDDGEVEEGKSPANQSQLQASQAPSSRMFPYLSAAVRKMSNGAPGITGLTGLAMKRSLNAVNPRKAAVFENKFKKLTEKELSLQGRVLNLNKYILELLSDSVLE